MDFNEFLKERGFTNEEIRKLGVRRKYFHLSEKTFMENYDLCVQELQKLGFDYNSAKTILILNPCNIKQQENYKDRYNFLKQYLSETKEENNLYIISRYLRYDKENILEKTKFLKKYNFDNEDIKRILEGNFSFLTVSYERMKEVMEFLYSVSDKKSNIKELVLYHSKSLFNKTKEELNQKILRYCDYGFSRKQAYNMAKIYIKIIVIPDEIIETAINIWKTCDLKDEEIIEKLANKPKLINVKIHILRDILKDLRKHDFSDSEIKKLLLNADEITCSNWNKIEDFYKEFYKLNIDDEKIKIILLKNSKLLYHSSLRIGNTYNVLKNAGLNHDVILNIFIVYPRIFESSEESLKEKLKLLKELDILDLTVKNPMNLIQGPEKTLLRYLYIFNCLEEEIDENNFILIYSKTKKIPDINELRKLFSYKSYVDNKLENRLENASQAKKKVKCIN